jgi:hypothetical protein
MLKIIFLSFSLIGNWVSNDTLMEAFYNDRVYYNLILDDNEQVLVSSNEGVFQIEGSELQKVNGNRGYISLQNGRPTHSKFTDEEMNSRYNHLLPDYYKGFNHFSREKGNYIYLISNNSLFIFEVSDYKTHLPKSSVRAFSANSIGTYNGIYCYGKRITLPDYTSGHIREQDSTFYICYDGLAVYKPNDSLRLFKRDLTGEAKFGEQSVGFARDIFKLNDGRFLLATTKGLYILNSTFTSVEKIYEEASENGAEIIHVDQQSETLVVTFSINNSLYEYSLLDDELLSLVRLKKSIEDGFKTDDNNQKKYVLLTDSELFIVTSSSKEPVAFNEFSNAYSLINYDKDKVLITTIDGALAFNLSTKRATKLFGGLEFNKRALFKNADSIKLGTVNGYVSLSIGQLESMIEEVDSLNEAERKSTFFITIIAILIIVSLASIGFYLISLKRKKPETNKAALHEVEAFIDSNLNQVTIGSITRHFNLSLKELYALTYPNKPGKLITKKRKDLVKSLLKQEKDLANISELTGFSISYLKKIRQSLN